MMENLTADQSALNMKIVRLEIEERAIQRDLNLFEKAGPGADPKVVYFNESIRLAREVRKMRKMLRGPL